MKTLVAGAAARAACRHWLVLFDLYRATGQQQKFETLAMDYVQQLRLVGTAVVLAAAHGG